MSKLNQVIYPLLPNSQYVDSDEAKEVKENIKKLMLELIEELKRPDTGAGWIVVDYEEIVEKVEKL